MTKIIIVISALAIAILGTQTLGQPTTARVQISFVNQEGQKLKNVLVRAYRSTDFSARVEAIAEAYSDAAGKVSLRLERGSTVKLRFDDRTSESFPYFPSIIANFKADRDSRFEQVMRRSGLAYKQYDLLEIFNAYEFAYELDHNDDGVGNARHPELIRTYASAFRMMKYTDELTEKRYRLIQDIYGW